MQSKTMGAVTEFQLKKRLTQEEALFNAVASVFATIFLSPNPPEGKMIEGIGSSDNLKFLHGIQKAAWDMTYITYWGKSIRMSQPTTTWLLCSNDKAMKRIAKALFVPDEHNEELSLTNFVSEYWCGRRALTVVNAIIKHSTSAK